MAWQSSFAEGWPKIPRLLAVPALLSAGAVASERLFHQIERLQRHQLRGRPPELAKDVATHRTRLLASFGLDPETVHRDVEGMEHHISRQTLQALTLILEELEGNDVLLKKLKRKMQK
jgi:hypothetical protein